MRRVIVLAAVLAAPSCPSDDELMRTLNRFAAEYNMFADGLRDGLFDHRSAKKLSRLWRQVENSGYWPKDHR